jgi:hypothetical protein
MIDLFNSTGGATKMEIILNYKNLPIKEQEMCASQNTLFYINYQTAQW